MDRTLYNAEHDTFRKSFRTFLEREVVPNQDRWREQGQVDREIWRKAGANGFLCPWLAEKWGGPGADFLCSVIVMEELARAYESGFAMALHSDIIVPYIETFGSDEQRAKWLPGCASGEVVTALAMTEHAKSAPAPPYFSSIHGARKPCAPALRQTSRSTCPASRQRA